MNIRNLYRLGLVAAVLGTVLPAHAALAPNYQRLAELQAVLAHPAVIGAFDMSHPIDSVEFVGPDHYRVLAGPCRLDVRIVEKPLPAGMVGARQFDVVPGEPVCE